MDYAEEYRKILKGGDFLRDGKFTTQNQFTVFDGGGAKPLINKLPMLISTYGGNMLDYGCGKGLHWHKRVIGGMNLPELLGEKLVGFRRYDPYHPLYCKRPNDRFDVVICSDVMEHVPINDVPNVLDDINDLTKSDGFVFFKISTKLSKNSFLDGSNMHITLLSEYEWDELVKKHIKCNYDIFF